MERGVSNQSFRINKPISGFNNPLLGHSAFAPNPNFQLALQQNEMKKVLPKASSLENKAASSTLHFGSAGGAPLALS
ncbi:MAG: hypothetical protein K2X66_02285, partial [Cyanobacteria bacterium]|nr:hypothetical protein [Cyanobacteriota bacterium]